MPGFLTPSRKKRRLTLTDGFRLAHKLAAGFNGAASNVGRVCGTLQINTEHVRYDPSATEVLPSPALLDIGAACAG